MTYEEKLNIYNTERFCRDLISDINALIKNGWLISPAHLATLIKMIESKKITRYFAKQLLDIMIKENRIKLVDELNRMGLNVI